MPVIKVNLFDEEQKAVKSEVISNIMNAYFDTVIKHKSLFKNGQDLANLCGTVFVMIAREFIVHYLQTFNVEHDRKEIMKDMFEAIKVEVNQIIKNSMV